MRIGDRHCFPINFTYAKCKAIFCILYFFISQISLRGITMTFSEGKSTKNVETRVTPTFWCDLCAVLYAICICRVDRGELSHGASRHNGSLKKNYLLARSISHILDVSVNPILFSTLWSHQLPWLEIEFYIFFHWKKKFYSLNFHVMNIKVPFSMQ